MTTTLVTFIQHGIGSPSNQKKQRNKRNPIEKEEVKLLLFADYMILYTENPKHRPKTIRKSKRC